jgi:methionyl-tRNA formyltransferase
MISKEDGKLDFSQSAEALERRIRAMDPWPGAFADYRGTILKVWEAETEPGHLPAAPGTILAAGPGGILVAAGKGLLRITRIQAPGKRKMPVDAFIRGNHIEIGEILR